jgi:hypothetical protein
MSSEGPTAPAAPTTEAPASMPWWRALAMLAGLVALVLVVRSVGLDRIVSTLLGAAVWMPGVVLADLTFFFCETMAYRVVLGPGAAQIPRRRFVSASLLYYCVMVLAPLGRVGAEVARAATFTPYVGAGRATAAASHMQAGVLLANFFITVPAWIAVAQTVGAGHALAWLLLINGVGTGVLGLTTMLLLRRSKAGAWLGRRFPRLRKLGADLDEAVAVPHRELWRTVGWCSLARLAQLAQYAVLLGAIGGAISLNGSLVAMGVHLVGAGFGDVVPNQVGVLEGAYHIFADAVGLGHDPARAVSIALLARISQILIASLGLAGLWLLRDRGTLATEAAR